ncbi:MarR family transcriptional regulator [Bacillus sp. SA1-12]|uniref:MarR family winged helix-turn-helix transcriptional regulator n=1 Tax=Bacillus sp. SA1-12 TaxID=1455638 RepID=UPI000625D1C0|nr:MarR family transcriptional regulator [Bacillus sp. SA1-12]KKI92850.1 MarR family transcriptional regulator [Bacillus sp. SA1-12]
MNNQHSLETIELEIAVMVRRLTSITSDKRNWLVDRSAYLLLHQLYVDGSSGVKALANEFQLDISTVSRQAAALEQKGYVSKVPDPTDGRAYFYQITDSGTKILFENKQARLGRLTEVLSEWSDEECKWFGELLKKFNESSMRK